MTAFEGRVNSYDYASGVIVIDSIVNVNGFSGDVTGIFNVNLDGIDGELKSLRDDFWEVLKVLWSGVNPSGIISEEIYQIKDEEIKRGHLMFLCKKVFSSKFVLIQSLLGLWNIAVCGTLLELATAPATVVPLVVYALLVGLGTYFASHLGLNERNEEKEKKKEKEKKYQAVKSYYCSPQDMCRLAILYINAHRDNIPDKCKRKIQALWWGQTFGVLILYTLCVIVIVFQILTNILWLIEGVPDTIFSVFPDANYFTKVVVTCVNLCGVVPGVFLSIFILQFGGFMMWFVNVLELHRTQIIIFAERLKAKRTQKDDVSSRHFKIFEGNTTSTGMKVTQTGNDAGKIIIENEGEFNNAFGTSDSTPMDPEEGKIVQEKKAHRQYMEEYMLLKSILITTSKTWEGMVATALIVNAFLFVGFITAGVVYRTKAIWILWCFVSGAIGIFFLLIASRANSAMKYIEETLLRAAPKDFETIGGREVFIDWTSSLRLSFTIYGLEVTAASLLTTVVTVLSTLFGALLSVFL